MYIIIVSWECTHKLPNVLLHVQNSNALINVALILISVTKVALKVLTVWNIYDNWQK